MNIYTLTLNPAFDVHAHSAHLALHSENFADISYRDAGGKGINISRALCNAGIKNTAIALIGKENGNEFKKSLQSFGLDACYIEVEGRIRENITLHHDDAETRISFPGFAVTEEVLAQIEAMIQPDEDTVVTFTGSLPVGISLDSAKSFLHRLKERGAKIVLDCRSFSVEDVIQIKPWLVKPNQLEVSNWFGVTVENVKQAKALSVLLNQMGVENAMISLGDKGAVLASDQVYHAVAPKISAVSTVGAGDSALAGFLAASAEGCDKEACLIRAVAFGTAACLSEGNQPPHMEDVAALLSEISIV